jgi:hypothetical protein
MNPCNIRHKPAGCGMTPSAVQSNGCLMDVSMAVIAFRSSFPEHQCRMTEPAVCLCMLSVKRQFGGTVIKRIYCFIKVPPLRAVADATTEPEILSVRVPCFLFQEKKEAAD